MEVTPGTVIKRMGIDVTRTRLEIFYLNLTSQLVIQCEPLDICRCGCPVYSGGPKGGEYHCAWIYTVPGACRRSKGKRHTEAGITPDGCFLYERQNGHWSVYQMGGKEQLDSDIMEGICCK